MTPTLDVTSPDLGTPDAGSGDLYSAVAEAFNVPDDSASAGDADAAQPAAEASAAGEAPDAAAADAGQAGQDTASPYPLSEDGASYVVPKVEFASLSGLKSYAEAMQQHFPTAQDAQVAYQEASDYRAMLHDFLNGNDGDMDAVIGTLAGDYATNPQAKAQFQQSFTRMAQRMPEALQKMNQQAYHQLSDGIMQQHVKAAYDYAAQTQQKEDLDYAQRLDWGWNGKYSSDLPKYDPQAAANKQMEERSRTIEQRERAMMDRDWTAYDKQSVNGPKWDSFHKEIDRTLEPVKAKYSDIEYGAIRDRIAKEVIGKLDADFEWRRNHVNENRAMEATYRNLWKQQQPADSALKQRLQAYHNDFLSRARRYVPSVAKPLLDKAAARKVAQAQPSRTPQAPQQPRTAAPNGQNRQAPANRRDLIDNELNNIFRLPA